MFAQQIINALSIGGVYGLASVGYALVYTVLGFSNFAHGELTMVGAFAALLALTSLGLPLPLAILAGLLLPALLAVVMEKVAYRPLRLRNAPSLYFFVSAMGVSIFLQNLALVTLGATFRSFPPFLSVKTVEFAGLRIGTLDLVTFVISLAAIAVLELILGYTKTGRSIRAVAYDREAAGLMGISIDRVCTMVFLIAATLAGLSGILRGAQYTVYATMGTIIIKAWVCAILGGLGSVSGAFVGGLLLGVAEVLAAGYVSTSYRDVFTFLLLIAVLLVKPTGLMGKEAEEKA